MTKFFRAEQSPKSAIMKEGAESIITYHATKTASAAGKEAVKKAKSMDLEFSLSDYFAPKLIAIDEKEYSLRPDEEITEDNAIDCVQFNNTDDLFVMNIDVLEQIAALSEIGEVSAQFTGEELILIKNKIESNFEGDEKCITSIKVICSVLSYCFKEIDPNTDTDTDLCASVLNHAPALENMIDAAVDSLSENGIEIEQEHVDEIKISLIDDFQEDRNQQDNEFSVDLSSKDKTESCDLVVTLFNKDPSVGITDFDVVKSCAAVTLYGYEEEYSKANTADFTLFAKNPEKEGSIEELKLFNPILNIASFLVSHIFKSVDEAQLFKLVSFIDNSLISNKSDIEVTKELGIEFITKELGIEFQSSINTEEIEEIEVSEDDSILKEIRISRFNICRGYCVFVGLIEHNEKFYPSFEISNRTRTEIFSDSISDFSNKKRFSNIENSINWSLAMACSAITNKKQKLGILNSEQIDQSVLLIKNIIPTQENFIELLERFNENEVDSELVEIDFNNSAKEGIKTDKEQELTVDLSVEEKAVPQEIEVKESEPERKPIDRILSAVWKHHDWKNCQNQSPYPKDKNGFINGVIDAFKGLDFTNIDQIVEHIESMNEIRDLSDKEKVKSIFSAYEPKVEFDKSGEPGKKLNLKKEYEDTSIVPDSVCENIFISVLENHGLELSVSRKLVTEAGEKIEYVINDLASTIENFDWSASINNILETDFDNDRVIPTFTNRRLLKNLFLENIEKFKEAETELNDAWEAESQKSDDLVVENELKEELEAQQEFTKSDEKFTKSDDLEQNDAENTQEQSEISQNDEFSSDVDNAFDDSCDSALDLEISALNERLANLEVGEVLILDNVSNEAYHAVNGDSSTKIKDSMKSLMYYNKKHNTGEIEKDSGVHFCVGNLTHALALEPQKVNQEYVLKPEMKEPTEPQLFKYSQWLKDGKPENQNLKPSDKIISDVSEWISIGQPENQNLKPTDKVIESCKDYANCTDEGAAKAPTQKQQEQFSVWVESGEPEPYKGKPTDKQIEQYTGWVESGEPEPYKGKPTDVALERIDFWNKFNRENEHLTIVGADDWNLGQNMADALRSDPDSKPVICHPQASFERSYFKIDEDTGRLIKCRTDIDLGSIAADVKTIHLRGNPDEQWLLKELEREIKKRKYDFSAAMYLDITGKKQFVWYFVNKEPNYHWVAAIKASQETIDRGLEMYRAQLEKIDAAEKSGLWPKPSSIQRSLNEHGKYEIPTI